MRSRIRKALNVRANGPWILASALLVALLVAPFAGAFGEGNSVRGGARNPSPDARRAYTKETQIIANVSTYGTRQSNKSSNGGGAVYGCRSATGCTPKGNEPCLRASNLTNGRAFEFNANGGTEVGAITGPATAAPFVTTAKGVATGLNADQVDGKSADEITAAALPRFATVTGATGALGDQRGATASARSATGIYSVDFNGVRLRLNKFAGSALKLFSPSWVGTAVCYGLLGGLAFLAYLDYLENVAPALGR